MQLERTKTRGATHRVPVMGEDKGPFLQSEPHHSMCAIDHYHRSEGGEADGLPAWVFELVSGRGGRILRTGLEPFMNLSGVGGGSIF